MLFFSLSDVIKSGSLDIRPENIKNSGISGMGRLARCVGTD
jgi:hypothetical protein